MKKILLFLLITPVFIFAQPNLINKTGNKDTILKYQGFNACFVPKYRIALWTAYIATGTSVKGTISRKGYEFKADEKLKSHKPADFKNPGYDMGHLTPAEDMRFSTESMSDCMHTTNIVPQESNFNRGVWKSLEEYVNKLAEQYDSIIVYTGAIYNDDSSKVVKTPGNVIIPIFMWKYIYIPKENKYAIYIIPNEANNKEFSNYQVTFDEWEKQTKLHLSNFKSAIELNK